MNNHQTTIPNPPSYDKRFTHRGTQYRIVRWRGHYCETVQAMTDGHWMTIARFAGSPTEGNAIRALAS